MTIISGRVTKGMRYGRELGYPTANLDRRQWIREGLNIRHGIYAGVVELPNGKEYKAAIVIGPLDQGSLPKLEAHLFGFKGDLYGKKLVFRVGKFIRQFKTYTNEQVLKQQIKKDIAAIKKLK